MVHQFMAYMNTIQKDTKPKLTTQGNHQWEKSLKEEIQHLKHKAFLI